MPFSQSANNPDGNHPKVMLISNGPKGSDYCGVNLTSHNSFLVIKLQITEQEITILSTWVRKTTYVNMSLRRTINVFGLYQVINLLHQHNKHQIQPVIDNPSLKCTCNLLNTHSKVIFLRQCKCRFPKSGNNKGIYFVFGYFQ